MTRHGRRGAWRHRRMSPYGLRGWDRITCCQCIMCRDELHFGRARAKRFARRVIDEQLVAGAGVEPAAPWVMSPGHPPGCSQQHAAQATSSPRP